MEIKTVELIHYPAVEAGTEIGSNGQPLAIAAREEVFNFLIKFEDGSEVTAPSDPLNRHYQEVEVWYNQQESKPFKFDFGG